MMNRKLAVSLGAVSLIAVIGAGSTFAYLTSQTGTVTNTFTIGQVKFEEDLGSGLMESAVKRGGDKNEYEDVDEAGKWTVTKNDYTNLRANENIYKDPTVIMASDSLDAWVFASVANDNNDLAITYKDDWTDVTADYIKAKGMEEGTTLDYKVYAHTAKLKAGENSTIFDNVHVSNDVTGDTQFTPIIIKACAVQADGFDSYTDALGQVKFAE